VTDYKKKLIEVALPLEAINRESAREKSIRHGHPSTLHLWWARRPLAACRAVLFASLVDDPSAHPDEFPTDEAQEAERERLFRIIEDLVKWENSTNEEVLAAARAEILRSTDGDPPPVLDPFCGGGSIPLEAQRLGLEAHASDLNPVAVLITKALVEIPPKFAGLPPVNPEARRRLDTGGWRGAQGFAEDVRYYGRWMRDEAERRIGHLYPKVKLPPEHGGGEATVIAWLWARTVRCPNPACGAEMPLVRSFALSTKKGKQAWVEPIVDPAAKTVRFDVRTGTGAPPEGTVDRRGARCIVCGSSVPFSHIRTEGQKRGLGAQLMAIVAEGDRGRIYVTPDEEHVRVARSATPDWAPETDLPARALGFRVQAYGMTKHRDLFTDRQLVALTTFSDLVSEARERVLRDAEEAIATGAWPVGASSAATDPAQSSAATRSAASSVESSAATRSTQAGSAPAGSAPTGSSPIESSPTVSAPTGSAPTAQVPMASSADSSLHGPGELTATASSADSSPIGGGEPTAIGFSPDSSPDGGGGPTVTASSYADAVATYLSLSLDKAADRNTTLCSWENRMDRMRDTFGRQALPMVWDYAETNPFAGAGGDFGGTVVSLCEALEKLPSQPVARVMQLDAASAAMEAGPLISTDPPYYDNIGYADLSDFFYVWLRRSLRGVYPQLFSTLMTPKAPELVATPYRYGGDRKQAQAAFESGLGHAFERMREASNRAFPLTVYYAFKQAESEADSANGRVASTGWETMLTGLLRAGYTVTGTWPMRSELATRNVSRGSNALASSVVLVCRPRQADAALASRREFLSALKTELPRALRHLQRGNIAPVDLAQASIGPGMAVFTRYRKVLEADGSAMSVRTALALINQALDEILAEQEGEFDADTRWALAWFEECGFEAKDFGRAETLSKAKNTSVHGMVEAGIVEARGGKVRLLRRDELDPDWDPASDRRITVWEMTQHLIRRLDEGEAAAAALAHHLGANAEVARDLAYRLYLICERKKWSEEGRAYNGLVVSWPHIQELAAASTGAPAGESQITLDV